MQNDNSIMKYDTTLPEDFDGVFHFTNPTGEDFIGKWGGKQYIYLANKTSPMIIPEHSPLEIQFIRKKFAKDLAEREYFKSKGYNVLRGQEGTPGNRTMNSIHQAGTYSISDLEPFIQECLKPLPKSRAIVQPQPRIKIQEKLTKDNDGQLNTGVVGSEKDLESLAKGNLEEKVFGKKSNETPS